MAPSTLACHREISVAGCVYCCRERSKRRSGRLKEGFMGFDIEFGGALGRVVGATFRSLKHRGCDRNVKRALRGICLVAACSNDNFGQTARLHRTCVRRGNPTHYVSGCKNLRPSIIDLGSCHHDLLSRTRENLFDHKLPRCVFEDLHIALPALQILLYCRIVHGVDARVQRRVRLL
jgi:hypothetical protein